jgi:3-methyladenine DNA glycosylase AlkD
MKSIIEKIRADLKLLADEKIRVQGERFFKEEVKLYGLRAAKVSELAKSYFKLIPGKSKSEVFRLCEELWRSGYAEEGFIACEWAYSVKKEYEKEDFAVFSRWVSSYISNWATCDTLCNHTIGTFVEMYPEYIRDLKKWAHSENRWVKRAAAVTFIVPARKGRFLDDIFEIADILHSDDDDMVQKGYGWMLKAASQAHQKEVFEYIIRKKATMPRTSLRYAIEKMPPELKKLAMAR